jgi:hypothetical protein
MGAMAPQTATVNVRVVGKSRPAKIDYAAPAVQAAAQAYEYSFGAIISRSGATFTEQGLITPIPCQSIIILIPWETPPKRVARSWTES